MSDLVPAEHIEKVIRMVRRRKVMLDVDLAALYGVTTFNLNKAVRGGRRKPVLAFTQGGVASTPISRDGWTSWRDATTSSSGRYSTRSGR